MEVVELKLQGKISNSPRIMALSGTQIKHQWGNQDKKGH